MTISCPYAPCKGTQNESDVAIIRFQNLQAPNSLALDPVEHAPFSLYIQHPYILKATWDFQYQDCVSHYLTDTRATWSERIQPQSTAVSCSSRLYLVWKLTMFRFPTPPPIPDHLRQPTLYDVTITPSATIPRLLRTSSHPLHPPREKNRATSLDVDLLFHLSPSSLQSAMVV